MEILKKVHAQNLVKWARDKPNVLVLSADLTGSTEIDLFRDTYPERFFSMGMAEQNMMSFAGGQARVLSKGGDIALFTSGICTEEAVRAAGVLKERGVSIHHLHISTLKPFNDPAVLEAVRQARHGVITLENHTVIGGLGTCTAEIMAEAGVGRKLVRLGLRDTYAHGASRPYLMREYRLDAAALVEEVEKLLGTSFGITEKELAAVRLESTHSDAKAEAL